MIIGKFLISSILRMASDNSPEAMALIAFIEFLVAVVADWYTIVLTGVIILFFIPVIILILFYAVAVFLYAYKTRRREHYKEKGRFGEDCVFSRFEI